MSKFISDGASIRNNNIESESRLMNGRESTETSNVSCKRHKKLFCVFIKNKRLLNNASTLRDFLLEAYFFHLV